MDLIHCGRADRGRQSARRPRCAEAYHNGPTGISTGRSRPGLSAHPAPLRRAEFGRSSEKLARDTEQLKLALEAPQTDQAERLATASPAVAAAVETAAEAQKPARRPLPQHLPREDIRHPAPCTCPSCGGAQRKISDEVTETLDYVPGRFKVVRHIRENYRAGFATQWLRHRRQTTRSPAGEPGGTIGSYRRVEVRQSSTALSGLGRPFVARTKTLERSQTGEL